MITIRDTLENIYKSKTRNVNLLKNEIIKNYKLPKETYLLISDNNNNIIYSSKIESGDYIFIRYNLNKFEKLKDYNYILLKYFVENNILERLIKSKIKDHKFNYGKEYQENSYKDIVNNLLIIKELEEKGEYIRTYISLEDINYINNNIDSDIVEIHIKINEMLSSYDREKYYIGYKSFFLFDINVLLRKYK